MYIYIYVHIYIHTHTCMLCADGQGRKSYSKTSIETARPGAEGAQACEVIGHCCTETWAEVVGTSVWNP